MQQVDDPPSLPVGTEVSAKYKGAFCEAKVRKVVRNIKVKVAYKQGLGSGIVSDDAIKSGCLLRVGATVEVKHPDKREYIEATITKIQDCSQYTVVFDDGDITTLRRTALCLKSGRHFNESETLDQLPLTHPEHFGNPVIGGRRGRRSRHLQEDSSDDEDENDSKEVVSEKEENVGKIVCVESTETKKKDKEKWFPGLVVSPTAQVTVRIRVKDEYLVRSFKDGRYYTVPKKEATEFTRELAAKQDGPAVQAALEFLDNDILPPHWDRDALFGLTNSSSEYEGEVDSDSSDDEPREEKDHFVAQLYKYMDDRGTPLNKVPSITNRDVDLYRLYRAVQKLGGYNRVTSQNQWKSITMRLGFTPVTVSVTNLVKQAYKKFLQPFEEFNRKLGCSMSMTPRNSNRSKGRSLVRANSVASPKPEVKEKQEQQKSASVATASVAATTSNQQQQQQQVAEESENTSESSNMDMTNKSSKRKLSTGSNKVKTLVDKFEEKNKDEPEHPTIVMSKSTKQSAAKDDTTNQIQTTPTSSGRRGEKGVGRKSATAPVTEEKRGRKKKEVPVAVESEKQHPERSVEPTQVTDFPVEVGDKLKVYYHEKKVTYEAKVIDLSIQQGTPLYLVHYTGWNTRYDEWVPKERIAENISNNKTKRTKGAGAGNQKLSTMTNETSGKSTANSDRIISITKTGAKRGRGRSDSHPSRSSTPSISITTIRTKSPAAATNIMQRRTTRGQQPSATVAAVAAAAVSRRTSNNISDISSSMQTDSDSDSDDAPVKKPTKSTTSSNASGASSVSTQATAGSVKAPTPDDTKSASSTAANSPSETEEDEASLGVSGTGTNGTSAKGRDYDLNQIRSELKGLNELKSPSPEGDAVSSQLTTSSDKTQSSVFSFGGSSTIVEDSVESTKQIMPTNNTVSTTIASTTTTTTKVTTSSPPINPVIADLKALSSTDLSSETDSFADDDSQSSDKTTTLENMTEKLQQKIKAEKLAQAKCLERLSASGPVSSLSGVTGKTAIEKIAPLKSAGIEKIIKESLAEKMQETLKAANTAAAAAAAASKPFLNEKSIYKPLITSSSVISNIEKDEKPKPSQILEIKTPSKQQQQLQNTFLNKSSSITTPEKKIIAPLIETKTPSTPSSIRGGLEGRKITQILDKSNTTPQITIKAAQQKDSTSDITITSTSQHFHHNQPMIQQSSSSSSILAEKSLKDISKSSTSSPSSLTSSTLIKQSASTAVAAAAAATDVYEFKEPEPFEFEGRKPTSVIIHSNLDASEGKKKKTASQKIEVMQETKTTVALSMTTPPTVLTTNRRNKKSPLKDQHHHQQQSLSDIRSAKQVKIEEKSLLAPEITQTTIALITTTVSITTTMTPPITITGSVSSSGGLLSVTKPENPFDALRKSPSFNLNINALNEELATTVQETAKALPDVPATERQIPVTLATPSSSSLSAAVSSSILTPAPAIVTPQKLMPSFISPFVESKTYTTDAPHVFEMKSDDESTKSGSDQSSDNKSSKKKTEFETVKKILLSSDSSAFDDLEPPKIEKPSIADKVLKALNQQKQEEKNIIKETSSQSSPLLTSSLSQSSTLIKPEPSSSATRLSEKLTSIAEMAQISFSISEPPKIELPAIIKKEIEIPLKKPILSSPEHKLDILESIAPKNNDLSETIQKLESVIQKTSNVDHFDDDSSDSTDSERRLVIEDDSQDSDNQMSQQQHQQSQQQQIVEIKNNNISSLTSISHSSGTITQSISTPITITQITQAINNTKKEPIKDEDKDFKPITVTPITTSIIKQESSIKPTTILKTDDILLSATKCNISNFSTSKFHHQSSIFNMKPSSIIFSDSSILSDSGVKPIIDSSSTPSPLKIESGLLNQKPKHELSIIQQQQQQHQTIMPPDNIITIPSHSTITTNSTNFTSTNLIGATIQIPPPLPPSLKDDQMSNIENLNIHSESINLLLCEETIPGSPTPIRDTAIIDIKPNIHPIESDIKPVPMDIECDAIPVGNIANVRIINTSSSTTKSMGIASVTTTSSTSMKTSIKCESSGGGGGTTVNPTGTGTGENQTPNSSPRDSVSQDDSGEDFKKQIEQDIVDSTKKRRRTRKHSECELISYSVSKRRRTAAAALASVRNVTTTEIKRNGMVKLVGRGEQNLGPYCDCRNVINEDLSRYCATPSTIHRFISTDTHNITFSNRCSVDDVTTITMKPLNFCSDSEDNSDAIIQRVRPTRPCQYNFLVQLDPAMNPNQRISILRKKIQELRKTYNMIKAELASIDRRRKKLRRKKNQQKLLTTS